MCFVPSSRNLSSELHGAAWGRAEGGCEPSVRDRYAHLSPQLHPTDKVILACAQRLIFLGTVYLPIHLTSSARKLPLFLRKNDFVA